MKQELNALFQRAQKQDRLAQKALFDMFSPKMLAIAYSYVNSREDAEDVLVESFCKAFQKIAECREAQSFGFWLRKMVVNDAINFIRRNKNLLYRAQDAEDYPDEEEPETEWPAFDAEAVLAQMPLGYRLVFNLYVFEEKKHPEIAALLNISEGTSRSQYSKARNWLKEFFKQQQQEQCHEQ